MADNNDTLDNQRQLIAAQIADYMDRRYDGLTTRQYAYQLNRILTVLYDRAIRLYLENKEGKI